MARISESTISNIRNHADVVDVISQYMPLSAKGRNFVGVCPFHEDHNPSMSVSRDKQIYHCFVCGAGGNVFNFVKEFEHISFVESVKRVADMVNIPLEIENYQQKVEVKENLKPIYSILQESIDFCAYELRTQDATHVQDYLKKRNVTQELIDKFEIGFNPSGDSLYKFLHAKKYSDEDMVRANVVRIGEYGAKDVFYGRLMIPIHNADGQPVGFTARVLDASSDAKYINTAETEVYHKGNLLFNYHRAKQDAKKQKCVYICEGAMDVLAFEKANLTNAIATLGTACTDTQMKYVKYLNATIRLFYDGDRAGQEATYKFGKLAQKHNMNIEIVNNVTGLDPDEIIEKHGIEELQAIVKKTVSWIEFLFQYLLKKFNLENYSEKKQFAETMADEIAILEDEVERTTYFNKLKDLTDFDFTGRVIKQNVIRDVKKPAHRLEKGIVNAQKQIIGQILTSKQACEMFRNELGYLPNENYNNLVLIIVDYYRNHDTIVLADLFDYMKDQEVQKILLETVEWDLAPHEFQVEVMREAISKIKNSMISEKINLLLNQSNQISDPLQKAEIANEILKLRRKRGD